VSYYSKENKFILSGDVLFEGSVGRTDLPGGDFAILQETIKTRLYTLPEDTVVYSGHGNTTTIGDEMKTNPYVNMR
jgi:hydroxyacylglutathione hydrolase